MSIIEALIDADLVAYRCAATCEGDNSSGIALYRCNDQVERIIHSVNATNYTLFLSGDKNFRKEIDPTYKANRTQPKPKWLNACKEFLVTEWNAKVTDGIEADDALGIAQREDTYICSLDKDLLQIPGMHFNWVKDEEYYITEEEGLYNFYTQLIVGDVADNIFCIRGLGPKKAAKILDPIEGETLEELEKQYYTTVASLYDNINRMHNNARLLYILRNEGKMWLSPEEKLKPKKRRGRPPGSKASLQVSLEVVAESGLLSTNA